ncbi:MAG TPA: agmatinase [Candidatus Bathyarchaeia archaeon]|nr:agmatinase [Candidatus Bathyarchaeia archaeon]
MIFADSGSDYSASKYVIHGVLYDGTSSFRSGSRWAPEAVRKASHSFEPYDFECDCELSESLVYDLGDTEYGNLDDMIADLEETTSRIAGDGKVPIALGGEHSLTFPCVKALENKENLVVVIFDAHLDFKKNYLGNEYGHACVSWNLSGLPVSMIQIGIRSGARDEYERALDASTVYTADQIRQVGIKKVVSDVRALIASREVYLSIDMDVLDPAHAPGVGNPEPYGLTPLELRTAIRDISSRVVGFDIVEITPDYDMGSSALVGAKLVRDFLFARLMLDYDKLHEAGTVG